MPEALDLRGVTLDDLTRTFTGWGHSPYRARQVLKWVHKGVADFGQMTDLSRSFREELAGRAYIGALKLDRLQHSADGSRKLRWLLEDGLAVESVLIPEADHHTLCVSSQVGCAQGCRFCLTAKQGFVRQLTAGEIVGQVLAARPLASPDRPLTNLVFMGMGEPLANFANLVRALAIIKAPWGLNFSYRRVTVSTVGLAPLIPRLGQEELVTLTISLNAPDNDTRSAIMPVNRRHPIEEVLAACRAFPLPRHRRLTFAYVLLDGVNDAPAQARALARLLRGFRAKINLIPFNPHPRLPFRTPPPERVAAFQDILREAHYPVFLRESRGADIAAACGQLIGE